MRESFALSARKKRGSAVVEFAMSFAVLFPLMTGLLEFGHAFFIYIQLGNAVREGARYASLITYDSATTDISTAYGNAVQNMVVYGDPAGGTSSLIPNLTTEHVSVAVTFANNVPSSVTVSVRNYGIQTFFKTLVLQRPACTFPYVGRYAPAGL